MKTAIRIDLWVFLKTHGLTQEDMAAAMKVSRQFVSQIMTGRRPLPEKYVPVLRDDLGIPKRLLKRAA